MYRRIERCRACGNSRVELLLDLGEQALTGVFPHQRDTPIPSGPLRLVKCHGEGACNLVQLENSYAADEMYGANYGYRSGLNASMVSHLQGKVQRILDKVERVYAGEPHFLKLVARRRAKEQHRFITVEFAAQFLRKNLQREARHLHPCVQAVGPALPGRAAG